MSSNYPELTFTDTEEFDSDRLNQAMQVLDQRLRSLEPFTPSWEAAVNELRTFGLARLNDAIVPTLERVHAACRDWVPDRRLQHFTDAGSGC